MPQKKVFWQIFFLNIMQGLKSAVLANFHSAKMALFNPCMKFKFFFGQTTSCEAL